MKILSKKNLFIFSLIGLFLYFSGSSLFHNLTKKTLSKYLKTEVSYDSLNINLLSLLKRKLDLNLEGLKIKNIETYKEENLLSLERIEILMSLKEILKDKYIIQNISINDLNIYIEYQAGKSNIQEWLKILSEPNKTRAKEKNNNDKLFSIQQFEINNLSIHEKQDLSIGALIAQNVKALIPASENAYNTEGSIIIENLSLAKNNQLGKLKIDINGDNKKLSGKLFAQNLKSSKLLNILLNSFPIKNNKETKQESVTSEVSANFYLKDNILHTTVLDLKSKIVNASGEGQVNLKSKDINYNINVKGLSSYLPLEQMKLNYLIPASNIFTIKVNGTYDKPSIIPILNPLPEAPKGIIDKSFGFLKEIVRVGEDKN